MKSRKQELKFKLRRGNNNKVRLTKTHNTAKVYRREKISHDDLSILIEDDANGTKKGI